jgi:hypothetical protein
MGTIGRYDITNHFVGVTKKVKKDEKEIAFK